MEFFLKINKISYKLILYIFLISSTITSIFIYFQLTNEYKAQISQFEIELNNIKNNRLDILAQAIWTVDNDSIEVFLKDIVDNEKIIFAQIYEGKKKLISYGKNKNSDVIKKEFKITKKLNNKTHNIGTLTIVADLDPLYIHIKKSAIQTIIVEIFKILVIALLVIFVIKRFLINYLEKMADYANNSSLSNLHIPLKLKNEYNNVSNDEIDIVTNSINSMRENLLNEIEKNRKNDNILAQQTKMAAMGEMIGNIAHQWRQPLSVITTASSGIKIEHEMGLLTDKRLVESLNGITKSAKYLSSTIDDFRDFFKQNKEKANFNIKDTVTKTLSLISNQLHNNEIQIIKNIENVTIFGLENELIQVLINILNNSRDELIKKTEQVLLIFIHVYTINGQVIIEIKDNAGGIKEDIIDRIFEPYFTTKHKSQGTGIGLYMSEEIISKHMNGEIIVTNDNFSHENNNYTGANFLIKLPFK